MDKQDASSVLSNTRIDYFDLAKGLGIVSVLIGHSMLGEYINILIYCFHMPLFFFICGYFAQKSKRVNKRWVKKKALNVVIPYGLAVLGTIMCSVLVEEISGLLTGENDNHFFFFVINWLWAGGLGTGYHLLFKDMSLPAIGPIWFVLALFWALLLLELLKKISPLTIVMPALFISLLGICSSTFIRIPWSIQEGMGALIFVAIGYEYRKRNFCQLTKNKKVRIGILIIAVVYTSLCLVTGCHIDMVKNDYPFLVIDIIGTISVVILVLHICCYISKTRIRLECLKMIGRCSLWVLVFHTIEINAFPWYIIHKICSQLGTSELSNIIIAALRICGAIMVSTGIEKIRSKRQFGHMKS